MSRRSPKIFSVAGVVLSLGVLSFGTAACSEDAPDAAPEPTAAPETTVATTTTLGPYVPPPGDIVGEALVAANVPELAASSRPSPGCWYERTRPPAWCTPSRVTRPPTS